MLITAKTNVTERVPGPNVRFVIGEQIIVMIKTVKDDHSRKTMHSINKIHGNTTLCHADIVGESHLRAQYKSQLPGTGLTKQGRFPP